MEDLHLKVTVPEAASKEEPKHSKSQCSCVCSFTHPAIQQTFIEPALFQALCQVLDIESRIGYNLISGMMGE